jgi:hypothetical protein
MSLLGSLKLGNYKESAPSEKKERKEPKFFLPGEYDLKIVEAYEEEKGSPSKDPSWKKLALKFSNEDETKSVRTWVQFPTESLEFKNTTEKGAKFHVDTLLAVIRAFGHSTSESALVDSICAVFETPSKLVGKTIKVKIGYKGNHLERLGSKWCLVDYKGVKVPGQPEAEVIQDLQGLLDSKGVKYSSYPEIVSFLAKAPKVKKESGF